MAVHELRADEVRRRRDEPRLSRQRHRDRELQSQGELQSKPNSICTSNNSPWVALTPLPMALAESARIKASLKRGEINPEEAREFLLFIAQYAGYPRAAAMLGPVEEAIAEFEKESARHTD